MTLTIKKERSTYSWTCSMPVFTMPSLPVLFCYPYTLFASGQNIPSTSIFISFCYIILKFLSDQIKGLGCILGIQGLNSNQSYLYITTRHIQCFPWLKCVNIWRVMGCLLQPHSESKHYTGFLFFATERLVYDAFFFPSFTFLAAMSEEVISLSAVYFSQSFLFVCLVVVVGGGG